MKEEEDEFNEVDDEDDSDLRVIDLWTDRIASSIHKLWRKSPWGMTVILLLIVVIVIQVIQQRKLKSEIAVMSDHLANLNQNMISYSDQLYARTQDIMDQIPEQVMQAMSDLESYNIKYTDIDFAKQSVNVDFGILLRTFDQNAKYTLVVEKMEDQSIQTIEFQGDTLSQNVTFTLTGDSSYSINVIRETENEQTKLNQEEIVICPSNKLTDRTTVVSNSCFMNQNQVIRRFVLQNQTFGHRESEIDSVDAILYYKEEECAEYKLQEVPLDYDEATLRDSNSTSASSSVTSKMSKSTYDVSSTETATEILPDYQVTEDMEARKYELTLSKEEVIQRCNIPEDTVFTFSDFAFFVRVTYRDGSQNALHERLRF